MVSINMKFHTDVCPICNDMGFIIKTIKGHEYGEECSCMAKKRIMQMLSHSGIDFTEYQAKTLESFNANTEESKRMKKKAMDFLSDKKATGIGYFGKPGTGKTHICIAICLDLTKRRGISHKYFAYRREIDKLRGIRFNDLEFGRAIKEWTTCPVLYIDDLFKFSKNGYGEYDTWELGVMFNIINDRYLSKRTTIFSSEYLLKDIINSIDEALGSRISSLIGGYGVKCDGVNRRIKQFKKV